MGTLPGWNVEGFVAVPRVYPTLIAAATTNWNTKSYNAWLDSIIYMMHLRLKPRQSLIISG